MDDDKDAYNRATDWWNTGENHFKTPREHLFQLLGLPPQTEGLHAVGKGFVLYTSRSPTALAKQPDGAAEVRRMLRVSADAIHLPLTSSSALVLRRGPYLVAAGLSAPPAPFYSPTYSSTPARTPVVIRGDLTDLFDAGLAETQRVKIEPGTRSFLLDVDFFPANALPTVLAASARITAEKATADRLTFSADGIEATPAVVRILTTRVPKRVLLNGQSLTPEHMQQNGRTLLISFTNKAQPQQIEVDLAWKTNEAPIRP